MSEVKKYVIELSDGEATDLLNALNSKWNVIGEPVMGTYILSNRKQIKSLQNILYKLYDVFGMNYKKHE